MTIPRTPFRLLLLLTLASAAATAQTPTPTQSPAPDAATPVPHKPRPKPSATPLNPNIILIDPAHGGPDNGAKFAEDSFEKDANVAFAQKLKTLLTARGFTVILTHEGAGDTLATDQRAELANRSHAAACILLHTSPAGHGVHLFTSSLAPTTDLNATLDPSEPKTILPWGTAQAAIIPQSTRLAGAVSDALYAIRVPLVVARASIAPIDSISCPAVALELAPIPNPDDADALTQPTDAAYQQRIAEALATALNNWRGHLQSEAAAASPSPTAPTPKPPKPATPPAPKPPKSIPVETPDIVPATPRPAAPIVRRPPPTTPPDTTGPPQ